MPEEARTRSALVWAVPASVLCGVGIATQARINGQLATEIESGYVAAVISFGSGLIILSLALLFMKRGRVGIARVVGAVRGGEIPWYYTIGGAAGSLYVLSQGLSAPSLGVALFSVGVVCGQTVSGVLIDRIGFATTAPRKISPQRLLGVVLALVAVAVAGSSGISGGASPWLYALPFISGAAMAWQQGANGQVRTIANSALTATFGNFLVGTIVLVAIALVHSLFEGWPTSYPTNPVLYVGGAIGIIFIALGAMTVGVTGVLLLALGTISGQLLTAVVLDLVVPVEGHHFELTTLIGTVIALTAVVIVALAGKRAVQEPAEPAAAESPTEP
jgi:bacterial/archaeal transporter family-2 protein